MPRPAHDLSAMLRSRVLTTACGRLAPACRCAAPCRPYLAAPAGVERLLTAANSALAALSDPTDAGAVARLGEATGDRALRRIYHQMLQDPVGSRLLRDKPRISTTTLAPECADPSDPSPTPPHSFRAVRGLRRDAAQRAAGAAGRQSRPCLPRLLRAPRLLSRRAPSRHVSPHPQPSCASLGGGGAPHEPDRRRVRAAGRRLVEDAELAYAMTRYREIHDFLHVLTGLPPTVEGELALKTLEAVRTRAITRLSPSAGVAALTVLIGAQVQTGLPMAALSALAGPFSMRQPERIQRWYRRAAPAVTAWAATCGAAPFPRPPYEFASASTGVDCVGRAALGPNPLAGHRGLARIVSIPSAHSLSLCTMELALHRPGSAPLREAEAARG